MNAAPPTPYVRRPSQVAADDVRRIGEQVRAECAKLEAQFFAGEQCLLSNGLFCIGSRTAQEGGRHYK